MTTWTSIKALLPEVPEDWSRWTFLFEEHGFFGTVQTDDPPSLTAYAGPGQEAEQAALVQTLQAAGAAVELGVLEEANWAESWKEYFKPRRVGARWLIRPTWEEAEPSPGDLMIVLDPGQAFGTGDHPTTRGCLAAMEDLDLSGRSVADIGCGSGILAVGAALMGAFPVEGVDVEAPAIEAANENAARNGADCRFHQGLGFDPLPADAQYDVVLSNIISAALIRLAPQAFERVKPGGWWITSGVITANWPDVLEAAQAEGFGLDTTWEEDGWVTARFRR